MRKLYAVSEVLPMNRKPKPNLIVRFSGSGVRPERIPLPVLSKALSAIQRLAQGMDFEETDETLTEEMEQRVSTLTLSLLDVRRTSAAFGVVAPDPAKVTANLRTIGAMLSDPDRVLDELQVPVQALEELSIITRGLGCMITIFPPEDRDDIVAKIEPDSYSRIARSLFMQGQTTVTAQVMRVGGATALKCALRIRGQSKLVYAAVIDPSLGRELGNLLYKHVTVRGEAKWFRRSGIILSFDVYDMSPPKTGSLLETLDRASAAGGNAWDDIEDPDRFLVELTGDR